MIRFRAVEHRTATGEWVVVDTATKDPRHFPDGRHVCIVGGPDPATWAQRIATALTIQMQNICPNCGSTNLRWHVYKQAGPHAPPQPHNRMSLNDVQVLALRACEECSETIETMDIEDWMEQVQE